MSLGMTIILTIGLASWFYVAFSIASKIIRKEVKDDLCK